MQTENQIHLNSLQNKDFDFPGHWIETSRTNRNIAKPNYCTYREITEHMQKYSWTFD